MTATLHPSSMNKIILNDLMFFLWFRAWRLNVTWSVACQTEQVFCFPKFSAFLRQRIPEIIVLQNYHSYVIHLKYTVYCFPCSCLWVFIIMMHCCGKVTKRVLFVGSFIRRKDNFWCSKRGILVCLCKYGRFLQTF